MKADRFMLFLLVVLFSCSLFMCSIDEEENVDKKKDSEEDHLFEEKQTTIRLELDNGGGYVCNNATVNWLLNVVLNRMSQQNELINELINEIKELQQTLEGKDSRILNSNTEISESRSRIAYLENLVSEKHARTEKLEKDVKKMEKRISEECSLSDGKEKNDIEEDDDQKSKYYDKFYPRDCSDVQKNGLRYSGIYTIYPQLQSSLVGIEVFCDLNTNGGGWTVIQRRQDGSQSFERNWIDYKLGFGVLAKEFWLGNENLHKITSQRPYELDVVMMDLNLTNYFANYKMFYVDDEDNKYRLHIGVFAGDAGDSMVSHDNWPFSTVDQDNDGSRSGNCAELYGGGGWWFSRCYDANLNGRYSDKNIPVCIIWYKLPQDKLSPLRYVEMKIRPL